MERKLEKQKTWSVEFDLSDSDTCHDKWIFNLSKEGNKINIHSVNIIQTEKGCQGHPKTIQALVKDIPLDNLDLQALSLTECKKEISCGMVLARCIESIKSSIN